uniref:Uncharacterized protein n=1 Tax=Steinernema glaseri TaxID=37863 RepID=A0A1I8AT92_9BILA
MWYQFDALHLTRTAKTLNFHYLKLFKVRALSRVYVRSKGRTPVSFVIRLDAISRVHSRPFTTQLIRMEHAWLLRYFGTKKYAFVESGMSQFRYSPFPQMFRMQMRLEIEKLKDLRKDEAK